MARAIWNGSISFGLVNVPVKLYSATEQKDVSFHQFEAGSGERIRYKRVAEESGREVDYGDIVKGYEVEPGRHVIVTPEELESVEPGHSRSIEIEDFIDLDEIDPMHFDKSYYLGPAVNVGAEKPYELLRTALEESNKVPIARFVMRSKQYLAAVRASRGVLVLETMLFPDEVREPDVIENRPDDVELTERERRMAAQLIESLTSEWEPERYQDTYRERVLELIERKAAGDEVVVEREAADDGKVVDLMAALEASVEAARTGRSRRGGGDGGGDRYEEMSRDELYDEAQKRDIAGRSTMSKDDLVEALRDAPGAARRDAS
jgi:DNA end-binding protein Ku